MPLVFVHGVGTREGPGFEEAVAARDALFRRFLLARIVPDPVSVTISNPYWGGHGARPAWGHASLPGEAVEALGPEEEQLAMVGAPILEEGAPAEAPLLAAARRSLEEAVDLLWAAASDDVTGSRGAEELANVAARAVEYARSNPHPPWLDEVTTDEEFVAELQRHVDAWRPAGAPPPEEPEYEALGAGETWARMGEAADRVRGFVGRLAGRAVVEVARAPAHRSAALFLGDILVYVEERGTRDAPGTIVKEVSRALEAARDAITQDDPRLIVVAHSMGGNILYDVVTHFRPDLEIDVLATVGSQVAFFEELKLYVESRSDVPARPESDRVDKPPNVHRWINVFDRNDILSFAAEGVFGGVEDFEYSTGKGIFFAHTTYFLRPSFHDRLGERVAASAP